MIIANRVLNEGCAHDVAAQIIASGLVIMALTLQPSRSGKAAADSEHTWRWDSARSACS